MSRAGSLSSSVARPADFVSLEIKPALIRILSFENGKVHDEGTLRVAHVAVHLEQEFQIFIEKRSFAVVPNDDEFSRRTLRLNL
jgi:hypothetical protein